MIQQKHLWGSELLAGRILPVIYFLFTFNEQCVPERLAKLSL